jgi:hypothetical protein
MRERRRALIAKNIQAARKEFQQGDCQPATPREIRECLEAKPLRFFVS